MTRISPKVVMLIRNSVRLTEVLQLYEAFVQSGNSVSLVLLGGPSAAGPGLEAIAGLPNCGTSDRGLAERCGIPLLSMEELADRIAQADLVMPC